MVKKQDLENKEEARSTEVELLRAKVAELEQKQKRFEEKERQPVVNHLEEIRQMRIKGQDDSGSIKYKDIHDHRNIRLWHTNGIHVGRSIGPIHPANAEAAADAFYMKGIVLSIRRPTAEQVARYKESEEYKALAKIEERRRESKKTMSKENSVDKLTAAVAKLAGIPIENTIRPNAIVGAGR